MADIELVIKIPEKEYKQIIDFGFLEITHGKMCYKAIKNGVPLPKGHGRLIDRDALMKDYGNPDIEILLDNMDTIIEADKEKSKG